MSILLHPVHGTFTNRRELTDEIFTSLPRSLRLALIAKGTIVANKANKRNESRTTHAYTYARKLLRENFITWGRTAYGYATMHVNHNAIASLAAERAVLRKMTNMVSAVA